MNRTTKQEANARPNVLLQPSITLGPSHTSSHFTLSSAGRVICMATVYQAYTGLRPMHPRSILPTHSIPNFQSFSLPNTETVNIQLLFRIIKCKKQNCQSMINHETSGPSTSSVQHLIGIIKWAPSFINVLLGPRHHLKPALWNHLPPCCHNLPANSSASSQHDRATKTLTDLSRLSSHYKS